MTTDSVLARLQASRIVPVVVIDDPSVAPEVAAALAAGGIHCAEFTLRTASGLAAIGAVAGAPGFTIGAGTVLTPEQVDATVDAGAEFIVSPGFDDAVVARAQARGVTVLPGIATATELQRAVQAGLSSVKLFPAGQLGGLGLIESLSGPFPDVRFMPSGGVSLANAREYFAHPSVFAVGGSWMVNRRWIATGDFESIRRASSDAVRSLDGADK